MGGKETIGDYYRRLDNSLNLKAEFINGEATPVRMREMVHIAEAFKSHGLTSPEFTFANPEEAVNDDQMYPINPYKMGSSDERTLNNLVDLTIQKRAEYLNLGLHEDTVEEILQLVVNTALHEVSEREQERKSLVAMQIKQSEDLKRNRPPAGVKVSDDLREAVEKVKKEGKLTPDALQKSGISRSTFNSVLRGQERVASSTVESLALLGGLKAKMRAESGNNISISSPEMIEFCRDLLNGAHTQEIFSVQGNKDIH